MTNEEARRILQCLHDGFDPITGEVLPEEHICNSAQVLRALHRAILMLSGTKEHVVPDHEGQLNAGRPWTDEDCSALRDLYRSGCSMEEICAKLHRRKCGVVKQLSRLGLVPTKHARAGLPWTSEEDELLDDLLKCDYTIAQIAEKMERTSFAIFCRLEKRQGNAARGEENLFSDQLPPWRYEDTKKLRQMFQQGKSIPEMAVYFHRPESSISARLFYLGLTKSAPVHLSAAPSEK